jgi:hypothetical protein
VPNCHKRYGGKEDDADDKEPSRGFWQAQAASCGRCDEHEEGYERRIDQI